MRLSLTTPQKVKPSSMNARRPNIRRAATVEDRRVTATEADSLRDLAVSLGVGADTLTAAHQMYLRALAVAAWADGIISDAEYADLGEVARLLGLPANAVETELASARGMTPQMTIPANGRAFIPATRSASPGIPPPHATNSRHVPSAPGSGSPAQSVTRPGSSWLPTRTPNRPKHAGPASSASLSSPSRCSSQCWTAVSHVAPRQFRSERRRSNAREEMCRRWTLPARSCPPVVKHLAEDECSHHPHPGVWMTPSMRTRSLASLGMADRGFINVRLHKSNA
jgi:hypothetical protein